MDYSSYCSWKIEVRKLEGMSWKNRRQWLEKWDYEIAAEIMERP